jgi:hypothetical protein
MLNRATRDRRLARRVRRRRYERRQRARLIVVPVEIGEAVIDGLIANDWLLEKNAADARRIGAAIADLLADSFNK